MMTSSIHKRWDLMPKIPPETDLELGDYSPVLRQLLYNRGIHQTEEAQQFLFASGAKFDPFALKTMDAAVERLTRAVEKDESIVIYGDYDVDGVTAVTLLVHLLRRLGANVREYFPDRFEEGYGVNQAALEKLRESGADLVITVDCGIRSPREVKIASRIGLDMIITDHHEPENGVPEAVAVICPRQLGDTYPEKNLAGVGLAYKLVEGFLATQPLKGIRADEYLDLVAVGTVADVVPLSGENRSMVKKGLAIIRTNPRPGLLSLLQVSGVNPANITARDIGYSIGPRLNAAGRLETARDAFMVLMADDMQEAGKLAQALDDRNRRRQKITQELVKLSEAETTVELEQYLLVQIFPQSMRLESIPTESDTHGNDEGQNILGVIGLVAGRLAEAYYRPAIVIARGDSSARASCRSIPEFHITHALDECSQLFIRHGGHAMAAGFTIQNERMEELQQRLHEIASAKLGGIELSPTIRVDMRLNLNEMGRDIENIFAAIHLVDPSGEGNPEPVFQSDNVQIKCWPTKDGRHLQLRIMEGATWDAIAFRQGEKAAILGERADMIYTIEKNVYNGNERVQLNVRDIRPAQQG